MRKCTLSFKYSDINTNDFSIAVNHVEVHIFVFININVNVNGNAKQRTYNFYK